MRPRLIPILFYFWLAFLSSCGTTNKMTVQNTAESRSRDTFERELPFILEKIPVNYELQYGFRNREEFSKADAGKSFNYFSYNGSFLEKSSTIIIPVIVGNEFRALASLDYIRDTLHIVDFGARDLAKEIQTIQRNNSNMSFAGLLRIYKVSIDFAIMTQDQNYLFFPMISAKTYLKTTGIPVTENYYNNNQIISLIARIRDE